MSETKRALSESIVGANINLLDLLMLLIMWFIIYATSLKSLGVLPGYLFMLLNIVLVSRSSVNGVLVLLLIFYSPAVSLLLPIGVFIFSTMILAFKFVVKDFILDSKKLNFNVITALVSIFIFYTALTVLISPNINLGIDYYKKYLESFALFVIVFAIIRTRKDIGIVFKWWAFVAGIALFIKLTHVYLGVDTALFEMLEKLDVGSEYGLEHRLNIMIDGSTANRFLWPGQEPNYSSAELIFPFAIALALFSIATYRKKIFWGVIVCLIGISVIGTFSRSGFLSIVLVLGLYVLKGNAKAIIPGLLIGAVFTYLIISIPQLHDRVFGISGAVGAGATGRFQLWALAFEMWFKSPLWGSGFAAYYEKYQAAAHNTYLQLAAETGLIGVVLFIAIIIKSLIYGNKVKYLYKTKDHLDIQFSKVVLYGLLGMAVMLNTITYQDMKLFWLICGICAAMYFVTKNDLDKQSIKEGEPDGITEKTTSSVLGSGVKLKSKSKIVSRVS